MSRFGGGIRAPKIGHPPSAVWQWWNCPAGAANHVEPLLGVLRVILDGASVCFSRSHLLFEWKPTARHNIDTKSRQFACNRCFESRNLNTNYALLYLVARFRPRFWHLFLGRKTRLSKQVSRIKCFKCSHRKINIQRDNFQMVRILRPFFGHKFQPEKCQHKMQMWSRSATEMTPIDRSRRALHENINRK